MSEIPEHEELASEEIEQDPMGYFRIMVDHTTGRIIAEHYTNENMITSRIQGKNARYVHKRIISLGLVSNLSHAAYIGTELQKAEFALEHGLGYRQDEVLSIPEKKMLNISLVAESTYVKAGKLVAIPDKNHDELIKVGGIEMSFKDFLRSRGLSRVF